MAPLTECLKLKKFCLGETQQQSFDQMKQHLSSAPILGMPNFTKPFQVAIDTSSIGIGAIVTQDSKSIAFFSKKLSASRQKWSIHEQESFETVGALLITLRDCPH